LLPASVADPRSGAFLTRGSGIRIRDKKKIGIRIPDRFSESLETILNTSFMQIRIQNFVNPESGMEKIGSGIRNKHPGSATLLPATSNDLRSSQKNLEMFNMSNWFAFSIFYGKCGK
jgi:hypothetical protein